MSILGRHVIGIISAIFLMGAGAAMTWSPIVSICLMLAGQSIVSYLAGHKVKN